MKGREESESVGGGYWIEGEGRKQKGEEVGGGARRCVATELRGDKYFYLKGNSAARGVAAPAALALVPP